MIVAYFVGGVFVLLAAAIAVMLYGAGGQRDVGPNGFALPTADNLTHLDRILNSHLLRASRQEWHSYYKRRFGGIPFQA